MDVNNYLACTCISVCEQKFIKPHYTIRGKFNPQPTWLRFSDPYEHAVRWLSKRGWTGYMEAALTQSHSSCLGNKGDH